MKIKQINKIIEKLKGKISYFNNIVEHISLLIFDANFLNKIDENPDLIGFDDCIYDLVNKINRKGKHGDYLSKSVGFNFPTHYTEYKKDVDKFLSQVFPNENIKKYVIQQHAQALSGRKGKDIIHTNTGIGGNGKSILIELLKSTFGQYYCNTPIKMLISQNNNNNHNTPEPFFAKLKGVRLAGASEPPDGAKINDSFLKLVGSQEEQDYRVLFSNIINKLTLQLKLHIFCNDKLKIKGEDGGIGRRMKVINYISRFDEKFNEKNNIFKIDYSLADKVKLWKADYIKTLIDLYDINYLYSCPVEIDEASKQYIDDNNEVLKFVKDFFVFTNSSTDFILFKDIKELYRQNKEYEQSKIKDLKNLLQKSMNCIIHDRKKINNVDYRGVIIGWTHIEN
jgi:phage/plasmid-associated DNA primase